MLKTAHTDLDRTIGDGDHGVNMARGEVKEIAYLGSYSVYHVRLATGMVVKSMIRSTRWYEEGEEAPTWGDPVYVSWRADMPVVLTQ